MTDEKRPYRKKRRAELEEQTRLRITESAVELHGTLGPSRTSMSAIAEHAGVRRSTALPPLPRRGGAVRGVQLALGAAQPAAGPGGVGGDRGPDERLRVALERALRLLPPNRARCSRNLLRDEAIVPASSGASPPSAATSRRRGDVLMAGRGRGRPRRVRAAIGHALAFTTWRSLAREQGLNDRRRRPS